MVKFIDGDLFETGAHILVNTVNCVGVMGKGVALAFKNRYPAMFRKYREACQAGEVQPGQLHVWQGPSGVTVVTGKTRLGMRTSTAASLPCATTSPSAARSGSPSQRWVVATAAWIGVESPR
jgi:O-acetyl-ADP-ribose deacetylase (regulator of RNase III)